MLERRSAARAPPVHVTPATDRPGVARDWFSTFEGAGLDGVVAKPLRRTYRPDKRVMFKVKHERTADCVVAGFRWHKSGPTSVGSLLLGLYTTTGRLQHVGVAASFPMARRSELLDELAAVLVRAARGGPPVELGRPSWRAHAARGRHSRAGTRGKDLSFVPLRPELVVEVAYDQMEGERFRHTAQFRRWRTDRAPQSCTYEQLDRPVSYDLASVLS